MFLLAIAACSGGHGTDPTHPHPGSNAPADGGISPTPAPTERDCHDQIKHALELAAVEQPLTADEATKLEAEFTEVYLGVCRASTLAGHHCAMAATTLAALNNCHLTPSSSTSNSKVAPPGMTPAAPRSP
jgi:hypothetical protein